MRIAILGDSKNGGGNVSAALQFAKMVYKECMVDYICEENLDTTHKLHKIATRSAINAYTTHSNLKAPLEVLNKLSCTAQRLYEQLSTKVYDGFILNRLDYLPVIQALNMSKKVPVYIYANDISIFEALMTGRENTTESPYRLLEMGEHFFKSGDIKIISYSEHLGKVIQEFNPKIGIKVLKTPLDQNVEKAKAKNFSKTKGILWAGAGTSYKNPQLMMKIVESMPDYHFTTIFNTKSKGRFTKIEKKYRAPNLTVLPSQPMEKLIELYQSHRIGLVTSNVETFCIVAQQHQLFHPTFVWNKNINSYHKVFPNLLEFEDASHFKSLIETYYDDEDFFKKCVVKGRKDMINEYSYPNVQQDYYDFLKEIVAERDEKNATMNKNTVGSMIDSRLGLLKELPYEDAIVSLGYADQILSQHSMLSQIKFYDKVDYRTHTAFKKKADI